MQAAVTESVLKELKKKENEQDQPKFSSQKKEPIAVVPYMHRIAHGLKTVENGGNVKAVFSAPLNVVANVP